jgi:hypothetical protein
MQPYNGAQNINPNAFNATNDNLKVIPSQRKESDLSYENRPGNDDSTLTTASRGKDFVQTRAFKSHATIDRVEKIMSGASVKYKVFLKNGKVLDAPAEKMENFATMAPVNILIAVGIEPKAPTNPPANPAEKKDQNQ